MKIIIKDSNMVAIDREIDRAEGRATARLMDSADLGVGIDALEDLLINLPKIYRRGITATVVADYTVPGSYGHDAQQTYVKVEWFAGGWGVVGVGRTSARVCPQSSTPSDRLVKALALTSGQVQIIQETMFASIHPGGFTVTVEPLNHGQLPRKVA